MAAVQRVDIASAARTQGGEPAATPRLVVMLVVDQMRADYLETFQARWKKGFATLRKDGAVFERAAYPYLNTVTCAGHATIGTGTFPHTHGMFLNAWWDRSRRALVTCNDDPTAPVVPYSGKTQATASGRMMRAQTFADRLRAQSPGSRVVSLSLKPRSAIGLAGHGGTVVTWIDDTSDSFATSRAFAPSLAQNVRDFLKNTPLVPEGTQAWTLAAPPDTYSYPDSNPFARPLATQTGLFPHRFPADRKAANYFTLWQTSPFSDAYLARMGARMLDVYQLGRRQETDVLAISFSALDLIGHAYGPESREVEDNLIRLDETIGGLLDKLDAEVGRGRYVLALTADHGVAPIPQTAGGARIAAEDVRERIEETLNARFGALERPRSYVSNVTFTNVYLADGVLDRLKKDDAAWRSTEAAVVAIPGVARLLRADRLDPQSQDPDIRAAALSFVADRSGDLIVITRPQWTLGSRAEGSATTHGTSNEYDRRVPLILFGAGVKPGRFQDSVTPADIAPTLARLTGVTMDGVEGRVLTTALTAASPSSSGPSAP
jgi:predicted AlkP superfamily pyrophosphatase or phosphodiesterase